jgi:hypothetical protein
MLLCMDSHIRLPGKYFLHAMVEGSSQLGICCECHIPHVVWTKEMLKQEHVSIHSIPGAQSRLAVDKARVLATHIGHSFPHLTPVIHKGSSSMRCSRSHLLVHSVILLHTVFSFRLDFNIRSRDIIQSSPISSILGSQVLLDGFKGPGPVLVIDH